MSKSSSSSPFRDETHVEEKLRRAEEEATELREKNTTLEYQLKHQTRARWWFGGVIATGCIVGSLAFVTGSLVSSREARVDRQVQSSLHAAEKARLEALEVACQQESAEHAAEAAQCRGEMSVMRPRLIDGYPPPLARVTRPTTIPTPPPNPDETTATTVGGPPATAPFDRGAAASKLSAASKAVSSCMSSPSPNGTPISIHTTVTFAPSGEVTSVAIDQNLAEISPSERACVTATIRNVKVPPFYGTPIRVGKTYSGRQDAVRTGFATPPPQRQDLSIH